VQGQVPCAPAVPPLRQPPPPLHFAFLWVSSASANSRRWRASSDRSSGFQGSLNRSNARTRHRASLSVGTAFCRLGRHFFFAWTTIALAVVKV
jgi:hypothetical protein